MHLLLLAGLIALPVKPALPCQVRMTATSFLEVRTDGRTMAHTPKPPATQLTPDELELLYALPDCGIYVEGPPHGKRPNVLKPGR